MNQNSDKLEKKNEKETVNWKSELISWIQIIIAAAVIALFLNSCIIANSQVPSESMENTIMAHDRVIGSRLSYLFSEPERGDVIIFHYPDDPTGDTYYVKRVIGLPGDVIDIHDGGVYLNGSDTPLDEPYIKEPMETEPNYPLHFEVPEDSYFMMGDNRNDSWDARFWENTWVTKDKLIAKVLFRYYPFNKMGVIH
ncbi:MAG: signal peptidase I [Lachnospiraceae bacterium]|jgi:signal peptidase I